MRTHASRFLALAAAAALLPSLALADPVEQPGDERGLSLGLIGPTMPAVLERARHDPYAAPAGPLCAGANEEIAALDAVLGPDVDATPAKHKKRMHPSRWVGQAMRSAISDRDVVRLLSGADRKQKALYHAEEAGWARRGYLKGLSASAGCGGAAAASAALNEPVARLQEAAVKIPDVPPTADPAPAPARRSLRGRAAARMVAFVR